MVVVERSVFIEPKGIFACLRNSQPDLCDALIVAASDPDKIQIRAHRVILAAFSSSFAKLFKRQPDVTRPVEVRQIDYNSLNHVINFIYSGELKRLPENDEEDFYQVIF